ncbi:hypothetical protein ACFYMO_00795 [Streptomyces sp. NPDC007025]|uniref:hypothetical protein n=1 Tax=Streptomyces sp. NPDC007025 TaxID=3364771 RepID=UPI0036B4AAE0
MFYDIENGIRRGDRDAVSFNYDARPLVAGEAGAGTFAGENDPCVCVGEMADYCQSGRPCISR